MREKFDIARQLDDATAREQHLWERAEAANSRSQVSEERLRSCLNDLSEANHERQKLRAQRSEGVSDQYEQRIQEMREQFRNEMELRMSKLQKECGKREFQLQELAKASAKRADEAEHRLADKVTGADRIEAEQRAALHAAEAEAAEVARLKIEEAYRAEGLRAASREQQLKIQLEDAQEQIQQLKKMLEEAKIASLPAAGPADPGKDGGDPDRPRQLLQEVKNVTQVAEVELPRCHAGPGEELSNALQAVAVKTVVLIWAPIGSATGIELSALEDAGEPQLNETALPLLWMDLHADSILQALSALIPESQRRGQLPALHKGIHQETCELRPPRPGSALLALVWLVACLGALVYLTIALARAICTPQDPTSVQQAVGDTGQEQAASLVAGRPGRGTPGFNTMHKLAESVFLPVMRFFDAFSVPEDVRRMAERRAELHGAGAGRSPTALGASGSEPEPEEMRRPAVLEALLAAEDAQPQQLLQVPALPTRPASPRFGDGEAQADNSADPSRATGS
ncbi:unnamed protein product [Symbiodinium natans]|uniref:Uncharacterized protein n=1 Tax=Symbiodinium natans TaxID=878477 RepID=A0A812SPN7_9DINO|nr:unnamed protein product [Symbiodinium natans]